MELKNYTKDAVAELLVYLADNEDFKSATKLKSFTKKDIKSVLRELADSIKTDSAKDALVHKNELSQKDFSANLNKVVSSLSPHEESLLFKSFRIS